MNEKAAGECAGGCYLVGGIVVRLNLPRGALLTIQPFVGLVISHESLVLRIPLEPAVIPIGQIPEVADRDGPATDLDVADGFVPAAHTIQKVFAVVVALIEPDGLIIERLVDRTGRGFELATVYQYLSFCADE